MRGQCEEQHCLRGLYGLKYTPAINGNRWWWDSLRWIFIQTWLSNNYPTLLPTTPSDPLSVQVFGKGVKINTGRLTLVFVLQLQGKHCRTFSFLFSVVPDIVLCPQPVPLCILLRLGTCKQVCKWGFTVSLCIFNAYHIFWRAAWHTGFGPPSTQEHRSCSISFQPLIFHLLEEGKLLCWFPYSIDYPMKCEDGLELLTRYPICSHFSLLSF